MKIKNFVLGTLLGITIFGAALVGGEETAKAADFGVTSLSGNVAMAGLSLTVTDSETSSPEEVSVIIEEVHRNDKASVLDRYSNLGVVSDVNNYLNVREKASTDSNVIGKVLKFGGVEIVRNEGNGWYYIESPEVNGYVAAEFILTGEAAKELAIEKATTMMEVKAEVLNVRADKSTESDIITQLNVQEKHNIVAEEDGWVKISLGTNDDGVEEFGYVSGDFVEIGYFLSGPIAYTPENQTSSFRQEIVAFAMQFLGGRYVWGGTALGVGVDCSGFTGGVYRNFGIYLDRCSYQQVYNGKNIPMSEAQPGDLLFYSGGGRINHVAMYIGNGQIIHASDPSRGIIISAYNNRTPVACVNVIGD